MAPFVFIRVRNIGLKVTKVDYFIIKLTFLRQLVVHTDPLSTNANNKIFLQMMFQNLYCIHNEFDTIWCTTLWRVIRLKIG